VSFEFQVHTSTLTTLIENTLQEGFRTTCLPSSDPYYIDHADVQTGKTEVTAPSTGVDFAVAVDVFVVDSSAVLAAPNGVPAGATSPTGTVTITLELSVSGTVITMACTNVDLGPVFGALLGSQAATLQAQIQSGIGTVGSLDISPLLSQIQLPTPSTSSLEIAGPSVLIRFDPAGAGADHIQSGQDWCLFADPATISALVTSQLDGLIKNLGTAITSHTTSVVWAPFLSIPAVAVSVDGKAQVPDPFSGNVHVGMVAVFSLLHTLIPDDGTATDLVLDVTWTLSVDLGEFVPKFIDDLVVSLLTSMFDPTTFGAIPIGPQEFELLEALPNLSFGGASFEYQSIVGLPAGMVLGGPVTLPPDPGTGTLQLNVTQFPDKLSLVVDCSKGTTSAKPTLGAVTTSANAAFDQAGVICDIHFVSPASPPISLTPYLTAPADGAVVESGVIAVTLPGTAAWWLGMNPQPIQLWVQTARGIRLLDLGTPPTPQVDENGDVTNYSVLFINDCPIAVDPWFRMFHMYNPKWGVDPPEGWTERLEQVERFESVIAEVTGAEANGLVRFEQPMLGQGATSVVSSDGAGRAVIPAMLATRAVDEGARLSSAGRQALDVAVSTAVFERIAVLQTAGATAHALTEQAGAALVTSTFPGGRTQTVRLDGMRIPTVIGGGAGLAGAAALDAPGTPPSASPGSGGPAQPPAPPEPPAAPPAAGTIPGLVGLHPVPGFEASGLQVAELDDGTFVVVRQECGALRAVGTVPAWPRMPAASQGWAISRSSGDRVAVYTVTRTGTASGAAAGVHAGCGCHHGHHPHRAHLEHAGHHDHHPGGDSPGHGHHDRSDGEPGCGCGGGPGPRC